MLRVFIFQKCINVSYHYIPAIGRKQMIILLDLSQIFKPTFLLSQYIAPGARFLTRSAPRIMVTRKEFEMIFLAKS